MKILYTISCPTFIFRILLTKENGQFVYSTEDGQTYSLPKPLKTKEDFIFLLALFGKAYSGAGYYENYGNSTKIKFDITKETL